MTKPTHLKNIYIIKERAIIFLGLINLKIYSLDSYLDLMIQS